MPEVSRFFGIIVRMCAEAGKQRHRPHSHVYYQDDVAIYGIDAIDPLAGTLPRRQQRLVEAWAELHQHELQRNWDRLQEGLPPSKIEPLR
jgi:Domain of unknown function (DUF4160)